MGNSTGTPAHHTATKKPNSAKIGAEKIQRAQRSGTLNLEHHRKLNFKKIAKMSNLRVLSLSDTALEALGDEPDWPHLKKLYVDHNPMERLSLRSMVKLEYLVANNTKLFRLDAIGSCSELERVDLSRCSFEEFPLELCDLKSLKYLNLSFNRIKAELFDFEGIERAAFLTCLEELDLKGNLIFGKFVLPVEMRRLRVLDLSENPELEDADVFALESLNALRLTGTKITKAQVLKMPNVDEYKLRRKARIDRSMQAGVDVDTRVCGL